MPDRAVILAAGLGTRLKWLTRDRPKALMEVAGEPVIVHTLRHLIRYGVRHVVINLPALGDRIRRYLGDGRQLGLTIRYSEEAARLDSGGGVWRARRLVPQGEQLLVLNAEVVSNIDLAASWRRVDGDPRAAALALVANPPHHRQGDFVLNDQHRVCFGTIADDGGQMMTFSGVSLWPDALLARQQSPCFPLVDLMRQQIEAKRLYGIMHHGEWCDIGRPHDFFSLAS